MNNEPPVAFGTFLDRLESEIRAQCNKVMTATTNRRDHPTYGYTKASILGNLGKLFGMVEAWLYVTGGWNHPGTVLWTPDTYLVVLAGLELDLAEIQRAAESS